MENLSGLSGCVASTLVLFAFVGDTTQTDGITRAQTLCTDATSPSQTPVAEWSVGQRAQPS
jgi:hypothetical protein